MRFFRSPSLGIAAVLVLAACSGGGQALVPATSSQSQDSAGMQLSTESTKSTPKPTPTPTPKPTTAPASVAYPGSQLPPAALSTSVAPGKNFNLSNWELQLPIGSTGDPTTISGSQLAAGYTSAYFSTDTKTGALDFYTNEPPPNCVTTANSEHCRSELMEMTNWTSSGTNVLSATLAVTKVSGTTVVGQIHPIESDTVKPLCELYYGSSGTLQLGVEATASGGDEVDTTVGSVPVGTKFSYVLSFTKGVLSVSINGASAKTFKVGSTFTSSFQYYFKAGDYGQGSGADSVSFYGIHTSHS